MQQPARNSRALTACALATLLAFAAGCGSNAIPAPAKPGPVADCVSHTGANAQVPLLITSDAALGPLLAFELKIDSITLTGSCGNSVPLLNRPLTIEWTHVNGASEPLLIASLPQDTYTAATVTYENPNVAYLWPTSHDFVSNEVTTGVVTGQVTFPSPIVVGPAASSILLDTLLTQPVAIHSRTSTVTPAFQVTQLQVAANPTDDSNGKEGLRGLLATVSSSGGLSVINQAGMQLAMAVDSATQYQGVSGIAALPVGVPVNLDVATQPDGSFLATRVQVEDPAAWGAWVGPLVVTYPQGGYNEVVPRQLEDSRAGGASYANEPSYFVLDGGTAYETYGGAIELVALPFTPSFASVNDTALGQGLSVSYTTQQQSASQPLTQARTTTLVPRNFSGTITAMAANGASVEYTIALAPGDLLTVLGGAASLAAYTNNGTQMETSAPLAAGSAVNMHGLLFNDGGTLRLVCDQVRLQGTPN